LDREAIEAERTQATAMAAQDLEKSHYPAVAEWVRKRFKCFDVKINKGIKYGRVDVLNNLARVV
jgi:hypothetical protein